MTVKEVKPLPGDIRFSYESSRSGPATLQPGHKSHIGRLVFDPKLECGSECYTGFPLTGKGVCWLVCVFIVLDFCSFLYVGILWYIQQCFSHTVSLCIFLFAFCGSVTVFIMCFLCFSPFLLCILVSLSLCLYHTLSTTRQSFFLPLTPGGQQWINTLSLTSHVADTDTSLYSTLRSRYLNLSAGIFNTSIVLHTSEVHGFHFTVQVSLSMLHLSIFLLILVLLLLVIILVLLLLVLFLVIRLLLVFVVVLLLNSKTLRSTAYEKE